MSQSRTQTVATVKFCKVCQDAGKPESEFRSHFTRATAEPNSTVVCPTLLALECRYCHEAGHTVKYCKILKKQEQESKVMESRRAREEQRNVKVSKKVTKSSNVFDAFNLDSDDEEVEVKAKPKPVEEARAKPLKKEEFPALPQKTSNLQRNATMPLSFARALVQEQEPEKRTAVVVVEEVVMLQIKEKKSTAIAKKELDWAAMASDSSDDDEVDYDSDDAWENSAANIEWVNSRLFGSK